MEVVASLSQSRTAAAQCGLFTHKSDPIIFEPPCTMRLRNSTEIDFWRRSARISRKDKIRNTIIKQKMNVTRYLVDDFKTKQLQWYGHVQRMEEGRLPKGVMKWRPPGRRKRGRPKRIWADGIRGLMGGKGIDGRRLE